MNEVIQEREKNKLRPCPFCGSEFVNLNYIRESGFKDTSGVFIDCPECEIETRIFDDPDEAVEFWNTRANEI